MCCKCVLVVTIQIESKAAKGDQPSNAVVIDSVSSSLFPVSKITNDRLVLQVRPGNVRI